MWYWTVHNVFSHPLSYRFNSPVILAEFFYSPFTGEETMVQRGNEIYNTIHCPSIFPAIIFPLILGVLKKNQCVTEITPSSNNYFYKLIKIQKC